ncbi:DUF488 family protein [Pseudooceanicola sp.]|uniref:DUF488 domain-containing protein n=1 Tax=Pseudooceanicola sp. TaxID=1914328 RepID=UPI0026050DCB|nr:DUF488 family protein [Pseudooceanicola sp.]MDF1855864.1 DUF488 family protein [Pseudooceanicola sp.]
MSDSIHLCRTYDARGGAGTLGARLLVDRLWPRGIAKADLPLDVWLKDVAPSSDLRKWFGHDPAKWAEFSGRYLDELKGRPGAVEQALKWCRKGPVTLLYSARNTRYTHAVLLRDVLQQAMSAQGSEA